jgi:hypothetical protein
VSRLDARHSRNLAARPEVGIVIFDSTVPEGDGQAVHVEALAAELDGAERDQGIVILPRRSGAGGAAPWDVDDVSGPAPFRLYRARASAHFVLADSDERLTVRLG